MLACDFSNSIHATEQNLHDFLAAPAALSKGELELDLEPQEIIGDD